jgi:phosphoglycerol transferase
VAACLFVFLKGWNRDFRVPFRFSDDALVAEMQSKSTLDHGWWWFNPRVGAPFGLDALQFPISSNVDQAVVWIVGHVVRAPAAAINFAWMTVVVLSGLTAMACFRRLGVSRISAMAAGTLFALTPYALYRNIGHFWMVIYLVPYVCTAAVLLATGRPARWYWGRSCLGLLAGCALTGLDYVYYAFFGCFVIAVAAAIGFAQHRTPRVLGAGVVCMALIGGATAINLAPTLWSWHQQGKPLLVHDKGPAEAETYGLKIRQLVSPGYSHWFPPFRSWLAREQAAAFPLETENGSSRLGVVAAAGFLGLIGLLFVPRLGDGLRGAGTVVAASRLTLAAVLLATVGGFGSVFSLLVSPQIRAYNRISPFIAFFSLLAVALALDSLRRSRSTRTIAAVVVTVLGLADQSAAVATLNDTRKGIAEEVAGLTRLVGGLESRLPAGAMVFQLPVLPYPEDNRVARMGMYDHFKLYLVSRTLRWSYPPLTNRSARWQLGAGLLEPQALARELAAEGFAAIEVDRYGYEDNGAGVVAALRDELEPSDVIGETSRYVVFDIRRLASVSRASPFLDRIAGVSPVTTGMTACAGTPLFVINQLAHFAAPSATEPLHVRTAELKMWGWAVDRAVERAASGVDVVIDETALPAIYGLSRMDVSSTLKQPAYAWSGFIAAVPIARFGRGSHRLALRIASHDGRCYYDTPAIRVVTD